MNCDINNDEFRAAINKHLDPDVKVNIHIDSDSGYLLIFENGMGKHSIPLSLLVAQRAAKKSLQMCERSIQSYVRDKGQPDFEWTDA